MSLLKEMKVTPGKSCFYSCVYNVFSYYNMALSEADIYLSCHNLRFPYEYKASALLPSEQFHYQETKETVEQLSHTFGLKTIWMDHPFTTEEKRSAIPQILKRDIPLILMVKSDFLHYTNRDFHPINRNENHCILLLDCDLELRKAWIADSYVVDNNAAVTVYEGEFDFDQLSAHTHSCLSFEKPSASNYRSGNLIERLRSSLSHFLERNGSRKRSTGIQSLENIIRDMERYDGQNIRLQNEACLDLSYLLKAHYLVLFQYILIAVKEHDHWKISSDTLQQLQQTQKKWSAFCYKLWKESFRYQKIDFSDLMDQAMDIFRIQEKCFRTFVRELEYIAGNKG